MAVPDDHTRVAFEVDDVDQHTRSGWSVLVQALAEEVTGDRRKELVERLRTAGGYPWARASTATGSG